MDATDSAKDIVAGQPVGISTWVRFPVPGLGGGIIVSLSYHTMYPEVLQKGPTEQLHDDPRV
jgi:hypothetical protein